MAAWWRVGRLDEVLRGASDSRVAEGHRAKQTCAQRAQCTQCASPTSACGDDVANGATAAQLRGPRGLALADSALLVAAMVGLLALDQLAPSQRKMVPFAPTAQASFADSAATALRLLVVGLAISFQALPFQ